MSFLDKKPDEKIVDDYDNKEAPLDSAVEGGPTFDESRTGRLLRKMDLNIVPFLALLYLYNLFSLSVASSAHLLLLDFPSSTEATLVTPVSLAWKRISKWLDSITT